MATYTALTTLPGKEPAEALGLALETLDPVPTGIGVFEIEDGSALWEVGAYFSEKPDDIQLDLLAAVHGAKAFVISELPETDWVAHVRRELSPVEAGRFFIYGSHDEDKVPADRIALRIEAAMAFGTGHHGTTLGCLEILDQILTDGYMPSSALDIGCGTAVLSMAAAAAWKLPVLASDIDPVAIEVAEVNVASNKLSEFVTCYEATGTDHPVLQEKSPYDLVLANILKGPLLEFAPAISNVSSPHSRLILSGILLAQADQIVLEYGKFGYELAQQRNIGDWAALELRRN